MSLTLQYKFSTKKNHILYVENSSSSSCMKNQQMYYITTELLARLTTYAIVKCVERAFLDENLNIKDRFIKN